MADTPKNKIAEIKKLENGKLAVRWEGNDTFYEIEDDQIAQYIVYIMIHGEEYAWKNVNSMCR